MGYDAWKTDPEWGLSTDDIDDESDIDDRETEEDDDDYDPYDDELRAEIRGEKG